MNIFAISKESDSEESVATYPYKVIIKNLANAGFTQATRIGINNPSYYSGKFIALTDSDVLPDDKQREWEVKRHLR